VIVPPETVISTWTGPHRVWAVSPVTVVDVDDEDEDELVLGDVVPEELLELDEPELVPLSDPV
jgi:hypothetical protein